MLSIWLNFTLRHKMHRTENNFDYLYKADETVSGLSWLLLSFPIPALLGPLPEPMTHRRLSDLLFFCLLGVPEDLSYLQDDTLGKYKSIKMHLMHPFLDLST